MRRLIYIPMIHGGSGFIGDIAQATNDREFLKEAKAEYEYHEKVIMPKLWAPINSFVSRFHIDKIYLEGISDVPKRMREKKNADPQEKLVYSLLRKGARLMPTEFPYVSELAGLEMFLRVFFEEACKKNHGKMPKNIRLALRYGLPAKEYLSTFKSYLKELGLYDESKFEITQRECMRYKRVRMDSPIRDRFIAEQIKTTLPEGETGILFLGTNHRVDDLLKDSGIEMRVFPRQNIDLEKELSHQ